MATERFEDIAADFAFLDAWEDRYRYVIDLGRAMPPMDDTERASMRSGFSETESLSLP